MTDIVEASTDRVAKALGLNLARINGSKEYIVPEGESPILDPPLDPDFTIGSELGGFRATEAVAGDPVSVTLKGGEAFIGGAYCARDTETVVEVSLQNNLKAIRVGWEATGNGGVSTDGLAIKPAFEFSGNSRSIPVCNVVEKPGGDIEITDRRRLKPQFKTGSVVFQPQAGDPTDPEEGEIWYNNNADQLRIFKDGTIKKLDITQV